MQTLDILPLPAGIEDQRHRFREVFSAVRALHTDWPCDRPVEAALLQRPDEQSPTGKLVDTGKARSNLHFVILPGQFADCLSYDISHYNMHDHLQQQGFTVSVLWVNGRSSCEHNAETIYQALREHDRAQPLVFIGYSKGAIDALHAIQLHPEIRERTAAVVSVAGAVYGSPIATIVPQPIRSLIHKFHLGKCQPGDGRSLESLAPALRRQWLEQYPPPSHIRYFGLAGTPAPEVVSRALSLLHRYLGKRYGANDSLMLYQDTMLPHSQFLGFVNADHFAIALPLKKNWYNARLLFDHNDFPREILLESVVRYVEEVLLLDTFNTRNNTENDLLAVEPRSCE